MGATVCSPHACEERKMTKVRMLVAYLMPGVANGGRLERVATVIAVVALVFVVLARRVSARQRNGGNGYLCVSQAAW